MPPIRLVLFDFDGTLCDSAGWFRSVYGGVARRYRLRAVADHEFEALRALPPRALLAHLGVPAWKLPLIAAHMRRLAARDAAALRLFPGAADALARLDAAGTRIAIVTSNGEATVRRVLGPALAARVAVFACGAGLFGKPAKIRAVLRRAGVEAAEALAIGDEARDIEAARAAGVPCGAVLWGYGAPALLRGLAPDHLFSRWEDVLAACGLPPVEPTRPAEAFQG